MPFIFHLLVKDSIINLTLEKYLKLQKVYFNLDQISIKVMMELNLLKNYLYMNA